MVKGVEKTANKEQIVLDIMKKGRKPMRPGELAKKTGIDTKEISKIISELKKKGKASSPKRCFYPPIG